MSGRPLVRHPHATGRAYPEEGLIVHSEKGKYHITNAVGGRVWELIDGTRTIEEIAGIIENEYDVSLEQAVSDVEEFVAELRKFEAVL